MVVCDLGPLGPATGALITVLVTPTSAGTAISTARAATAELDPSAGNNLATTSVTVALLQILSINHAAGITTILFPTVSGVTYTVEYKNGVTAASWSALDPVPGTGGVVGVEDSSANASIRIYRVRRD
jgi:hypothetical protein